MRCEPVLLPTQERRDVPGPEQGQSRHSGGGIQSRAMSSGMTLLEQGSWSKWPAVVPSILDPFCDTSWSSLAWHTTVCQQEVQKTGQDPNFSSCILFFPAQLYSLSCYLCTKSLWIYACQGKVWVRPEFADPWLEEVSCGTDLDASGALCLLRLDQDFAITCFLRLYPRLEQLSRFLPPSHWKTTYSQG